MTYAALIRCPGSPPAPVPPFEAKDDATALAIITRTASALGAHVWAAWESREGMARHIPTGAAE